MSKPAAADNAFRFAALDDAEAEYAATQPSACASSSETPKWIVANRRMVQERRKSGDGEPEPGPLPWMRIGQRGASNPLDVAYYDLKTCQEVPLEVTSTLDAFHRDGTRPQPKLHFSGQESWCLIREVPGDHGATSRVYLEPLRKAQLLTITLQPNEKIYRTLSGTYYCEHYEKHGCGCRAWWGVKMPCACAVVSVVECQFQTSVQHRSALNHGRRRRPFARTRN
jgi:hypothetical protein